jgi:hypothetical protein
MRTRYDDLQARLATGWNTWNTRSVLSHVRLPSGLAINLGIKEYRNGHFLEEALIGRPGDGAEKVLPGPRSHDGSYAELQVTWRGIVLRVESGLAEGDLVLLMTPLANQRKPATLVAQAGFLWNRPGTVRVEDEALAAAWPGGATRIVATQAPVAERQLPTLSPYLALTLDGPVGLSAGKARTVAEIRAILDRQRQAVLAARGRLGPDAEVHAAIQTCLSWDTIYDPAGERVISPVSRPWNCHNGGWVLFCWDTYFAAYLAAFDHPGLAIANAVEITRERTPDGFVPNTSNGHGFKTLDRSQPPVGAMMVREVYRQCREAWFVELLFDDLLAWNRWWPKARLMDGLLAWGSTPYPPRLGNEWETKGVGQFFGTALESGLDNSPMYDDLPVDPATHCACLQDVGLNGLYVRDCEDLADLAGIIGRTAEAEELRQRAAAFRTRLRSLWSEERGIFLNRRTDTGEFSQRLSPTNFYALLADAATPAQARRMVDEHLLNPDEFWGDWVLPSISRDDPAFADQHYWRGRIWAPMNFLVHLGLRRYGLADACAALADKSRDLLLKEWRSDGHVHENYCPNTGLGCNSRSSDAFYHWGGLLGAIAMIESGRRPGPETPLP